MRDIYIAILVAAARGKGLHLTADECSALTLDDAIALRAYNGLDAIDWPDQNASVDWRKIDPNRDRKGENFACGGVVP